jgi:hypothetical protein
MADYSTMVFKILAIVDTSRRRDYMLTKTFMYTSLFAALFMAVALRFMQFFNFIKWSPIGWSKKWDLFYFAHSSVKWILLFIGLVIFCAIIYFITSFIHSIPPSISALIIGAIIIITLEWAVNNHDSLVEAIRSISLPLFAVTAIVLRFISGTAVFMKKNFDENVK